jgi:ParB/RepB/Spo0J family partition protein
MKNMNINKITTKKIKPNPFQTRTTFDQGQLEYLANSIESNGLLNPITLRPHPDIPKYYELAQGERRLRACKLLKWEHIPAIIRHLSDVEMAEIAIIENVQRVDLNPLAEAEAYNRLIENFNLTQEAVAKRLGKSRPYIANRVRLLRMDPFLITSVRCRTISLGHAQEISRLPIDYEHYMLADLVMDWNLTVEETRRIIRNILDGEPWISWECTVPIDGIEDKPYTCTPLEYKKALRKLENHSQLEPIDILVTGKVITGNSILHVARMTQMNKIPARIYFSVDWLKHSENDAAPHKSLEKEDAHEDQALPNIPEEAPNRALFPLITPTQRRRVKQLNHLLQTQERRIS